MNFHDLFQKVLDRSRSQKLLAGVLWPLIGALLVAPAAVLVAGLPNVVPGLPLKPAMWALAGLAVFPVGIALGLVMAGRVRAGTDLSKRDLRARYVQYLDAEAPQNDRRDWSELSAAGELPEAAERDAEALARAGFPRLFDGPQSPSAMAAYIAWLWAAGAGGAAAYYAHNLGSASLAKLTPTPGALAVLALGFATCLALIGLMLPLLHSRSK